MSEYELLGSTIPSCAYKDVITWEMRLFCMTGPTIKVSMVFSVESFWKIKNVLNVNE